MSTVFDVYRRRRFVMLGGIFLCLIFTYHATPANNNLPEDAPVIISQADSTRALTASRTRQKINPLNVFPAGKRTEVTLLITNLDLLENEDARAFRADVETSSRFRYPLEIVSLAPTFERPWVYALTIRLREEIGSVGDVLVRVTWRGMSSNRVRISIGFEGGKIEDDEGAVPTPMPDRPIVRENVENIASLPWTGDRARFMEQATFGPTAALESRLRRISYSTWIAEQTEDKFDANGNARYSTYPYPNFPMMPQIPPGNCNNTSGTNDPTDSDPLCYRNRYTMSPLQNWFFKEAIYGEDQQLRRRVSWALHQIFVVGGREVGQSGRMTPYIETLDRNAFGNYRTLLKEMTLNPAMGKYLDMVISTRQSPNENFAREILQLFSIGVDMLNQDGTPIMDAQGNNIPTYNQETVNNFTKVFTGWSFCNNQGCPNAQPGIVNYRDPLIPIQANHDATQKTLLNYPGASPVIPAEQTAAQDLDDAINNIFNHPNVAPFVGKLLIQQLVTSNPTPAYVGRVAAAFNNNGRGTRGDMKAVVRAVLLDPEARGNIKTDPDYGKLREPVLFVTNITRPFNPQANRAAMSYPHCAGKSDGTLNFLVEPLGQDVWNPPSVFNYYPMDYTIPTVGLAGPEFGIFSTNTVFKWMNIVDQMFPPFTGGSYISTGIQVNGQNNGNQNGVPVLNPQYTPCGMEIYTPRFESLSASDMSGGLLLDALNKEMLRSSMSNEMRGDIRTAVQAIALTSQTTPQSVALRRTRAAIYLIASSPQFQVQR